ncbi:MAG: hypothetical protein ABJF04_07960 [Reichenbachiella sp.]|uniref:hypothetical protein n=1 Tax=Reichenbachiella sp. TaxID=2184521 RepID=UPI003263D45F
MISRSIIQQIEIHGNDEDALSIDLGNILRCIANGDIYNWSILLIEGIGKLQNMTMLEFEESVVKSSNGHILKWDELINLSMSLDQIVDLTLVADRNLVSLKKYDSDEEMYNNCDLTIELIDSSYWVIHSKNVPLNGMIENLEGVKII